MTALYLDTSALAKWYLPEVGSEEVTALIQARAPVAISSLTVTEMRSLLARRRREGSLDHSQEARVFATFQEHVRQGHLRRAQLGDDLYAAAAGLIDALPAVPLRSLDALHLAVLRDHGCTELATADGTMVAAARALDLIVHDFCPREP